jgi:glycosyltransferase involved in cell wall biosynthesis
MAAALEKSPHTTAVRVAALGRLPFARSLFLLRAALSLLAKPDLVIITHVHLARISGLLRLLRIPYWVCAHGIECWPRPELQDLRSFQNADRVLCVSRYTKSQLERFPEMDSRRLCLFPNHVETPPPILDSQEEARRRLGLPQTSPLLLTVSRLSASEGYKGHRELFAALPGFKEIYPGLHYAIAGAGDDLAALQKEAQRAGISGWVTFLGALNEEQLEWAYKACDAFVMPSTGEGFGIVFLEALIRGKPVLAGNRDGSPDPLLDGKLGVLADPRDPQSLHEGLGHLLKPSVPWDAGFLEKEARQHFGIEALQQRVDALLADFGTRPCVE